MRKIEDWQGKTGLKVGIASDHGGFEFKKKLIREIEAMGLSKTVICGYSA